jgi:hypothetical protein
LATFIAVLTGGYGRVELNLDLVRWIYADENGKAVFVFGAERLASSESLADLVDRLPGVPAS